MSIILKRPWILLGLVALLFSAEPLVAQDGTGVPRPSTLVGSYTLWLNGAPDTQTFEGVEYEFGQDIVPGPFPGYLMSKTWVRAAGGPKLYLPAEGNSVTYFTEICSGCGVYFFETVFKGQSFTGYVSWNFEGGYWQSSVQQNGNEWRYVPD